MSVGTVDRCAYCRNGEAPERFTTAGGHFIHMTGGEGMVSMQEPVITLCLSMNEMSENDACGFCGYGSAPRLQNGVWLHIDYAALCTRESLIKVRVRR